MDKLHIFTTLLQALIGAALVLGLRNDTRVHIFGARITRSMFVTVICLFAFFLLAFPLVGVVPVYVWMPMSFLGTGLIGFIMTAPHGQTLRGPHQILPVDEDDYCLDAAMFLTDHEGLGEKMGWPTWLIYNSLRYVAPCLLLGAISQSWIAAAAGLLTVICYWPIAWLPWLRDKVYPLYFGAAMCGFWVFLGL
jgi:hypothetical protein